MRTIKPEFIHQIRLCCSEPPCEWREVYPGHRQHKRACTKCGFVLSDNRVSCQSLHKVTPWNLRLRRQQPPRPPALCRMVRRRLMAPRRLRRRASATCACRPRYRLCTQCRCQAALPVSHQRPHCPRCSPPWRKLEWQCQRRHRSWCRHSHWGCMHRAWCRPLRTQARRRPEGRPRPSRQGQTPSGHPKWCRAPRATHRVRARPPNR